MICPPPAVKLAAAPLFRGYGSRSESRIQTRIQSRIQTPRSQARIDAPNGVGGGGLTEAAPSRLDGRRSRTASGYGTSSQQ